MVRRGDAETARAAVRSERGARAERVVHRCQQRVHARRELERVARRFEPVRLAHKQRVAEQLAQPRERVADRRLAQPEALRHERGPALAEQLAQHEQQRSIELPDLVFIDI